MPRKHAAHSSRRCPDCGATLNSKNAEVYVYIRKSGYEERTCKPCKVRKVTARHLHRLATDPEYAEAQHQKFLRFQESRRQYAIRMRAEAAHA